MSQLLGSSSGEHRLHSPAFLALFFYTVREKLGGGAWSQTYQNSYVVGVGCALLVCLVACPTVPLLRSSSISG